MQIRLQLHYITQHYTTLSTLHYTTTATTTTLQCTTLHYNYNHTTLHQYTTLQYTTIHCANYTAPQLQLQLQLHCTNYTTLQLQLTTTTTTALHHTTSSSCGWGDHCNHCNHSKKHNSNHLSVHQWICSAIRDSQQPTSPIGFLFLKLPPPPCSVPLVVYYSI